MTTSAPAVRYYGSKTLDYSLDQLREIAAALDTDNHKSWTWSEVKADAHQRVSRMGDAALVAETFDGTSNFPTVAGRPVGTAEYIATFDPPTVLALLDELAELRRQLSGGRGGDVLC